MGALLAFFNAHAARSLVNKLCLSLGKELSASGTCTLLTKVLAARYRKPLAVATAVVADVKAATPHAPIPMAG